ncbi:TspO/MBR family protein [Haloplanus pelagicus]|jgi:tryptophan-rich sensory protein|uniref:TspO/MBR family protein n=1 Tax=Haloplanus pelagicus TaxID=2949995 RepID=UPI00203FCA3E|nr:TspO/MBR family protein [Haloplanus sp. HW8-1]
MVSLRSTVRRLPDDHPLGALVLAVLVVELAGASGAVFTLRGLSAWYGTLARPAFAPPNWVFGPVWTALFALMGVAVWLVWCRVDDPPPTGRRARIAIAVFAVHFVCNVGWSAAFFGLQSVTLGLAVIALLWASIVVTIGTFDRVDRRAALLLLPYLAWVSFAAYLNYRFWALN